MLGHMICVLTVAGEHVFFLPVLIGILFICQIVVDFQGLRSD